MSLRVRVRNFQSIADDTIEIDGFTVITGTNNTGKSALMRAIKGGFTNPPPSFVRKGASHATVEYWFEDGTYLKWEKGPKINRYTLNGKVFNKVGAGVVPEEIQVLGMDSVMVGGKPIWPQFADQFTGPLFLLDRPGSAIADAVADVERIQKLNKALKASESDRRSTLADLKIRRRDLKEIEFKLQRFDGLEDLETKVAEIEKGHGQVERTSTGIKKLRQLRNDYQDAEAQVAALDGLEEAAAEVPDEEAIKGVQAVGDDHKALQGLRDRLGPVASKAKKWQEAAQVAESVNLGPDAVVATANKLRQGIRITKKLAREVREAAELIENLTCELSEKQGELDDLNEEIAEILGGYEACPICGSQLCHAH